MDCEFWPALGSLAQEVLLHCTVGNLSSPEVQPGSAQTQGGINAQHGVGGSLELSRLVPGCRSALPFSVPEAWQLPLQDAGSPSFCTKSLCSGPQDTWGKV